MLLKVIAHWPWWRWVESTLPSLDRASLTMTVFIMFAMLQDFPSLTPALDKSGTFSIAIKWERITLLSKNI